MTMVLCCLVVGFWFAPRALASSPVMWWAQGPVRLTGTGMDPQQLRAFLQEVLVRVLGSVDFFRQPAARSILANPEHWVSSHSLIPAHAGRPAELAVEFNSTALTDALFHAGYPVWVHRPHLLVLWIQDNGLTSMPPTLLHPFMAEARYRGLDFAASASGSADAHLLQQGEHLLSAPAALWRDLASRSGLDGLVLIQMDTTHPQSQVSWRILTGRVDRSFHHPVDDVISLWPYLADQVAEVLVDSKEDDGDSSLGHIEVSGISSLDALQKCQKNLQNLGLHDLQLQRLDGSQVFWSVGAGSLDALHRLVLQQPLAGKLPRRWIEAWSSGSARIYMRWTSSGLLF